MLVENAESVPMLLAHALAAPFRITDENIFAPIAIGTDSPPGPTSHGINPTRRKFAAPTPTSPCGSPTRPQKRCSPASALLDASLHHLRNGSAIGVATTAPTSRGNPATHPQLVATLIIRHSYPPPPQPSRPTDAIISQILPPDPDDATKSFTKSFHTLICRNPFTKSFTKSFPRGCATPAHHRATATSRRPFVRISPPHCFSPRNV